MWSFLVWVKQVIISVVLAWAGVNLGQPERRDWSPILERAEPGARACHAHRAIVIRTRDSETRVLRAKGASCTLREEESFLAPR